MTIRYERAPDIQQRVGRISRQLGLKHINERVVCVRSRGSRARYTVARCHAMSRVFQFALGVDMHYVIEVISETFDTMSEPEQTRTLIHELLHIPKAFGGGLKGHKNMRRKVNSLYRQLQQLEKELGEDGTL